MNSKQQQKQRHSNSSSSSSMMILFQMMVLFFIYSSSTTTTNNVIGQHGQQRQAAASSSMLVSGWVMVPTTLPASSIIRSKRLTTTSKRSLLQASPSESQQPQQQQQQQQPPPPTTTRTTAVDTTYYNVPPNMEQVGNSNQRITLTRFLSNLVKENPQMRDMESLLLAIQMGCKTIANLVNRAGLMTDEYYDDEDNDNRMNNSNNNNNGMNNNNKSNNNNEHNEDHLLYKSDGRFYSMKRLDQLSTIVLRNALQYTGKCECIAPSLKNKAERPAEHQPGVLIANDFDSNYIAVLDPLDGSGNADASICTGTIFGVYERSNNATTTTTTKQTDTKSDEKPTSEEGKSNEEQLVEDVLQPAKNMRAAGYCLYSSSTVLVISLSKDDVVNDGTTDSSCGVYGFTLDPQIQDFVLTHRDLTIPKRGNVYSCNEANYLGWSPKFTNYLNDIKVGKGETQLKYAHRYVGSMVGDIHRTLLYGGIFCYPSDTLSHPYGNLQLLYKVAPIAFIIANAGGGVINEDCDDLLQIKPERVHQKSPCFMGSLHDVQEVQKYLQGNDEADKGTGAGERTKT